MYIRVSQIADILKKQGRKRPQIRINGEISERETERDRETVVTEKRSDDGNRKDESTRTDDITRKAYLVYYHTKVNNLYCVSKK